MEEIDFLSLLEHFQEVVARHQLARYENKQNLPKKSKNLWQDLSQQGDKHNLPNERKQKNNPNELKLNKQFLTLNKTSAGQVILKSNRKQHKQTELNKQKKQSNLTNKKICGKTSASTLINTIFKKNERKNNTSKLKEKFLALYCYNKIKKKTVSNEINMKFLERSLLFCGTYTLSFKANLYKDKYLQHHSIFIQRQISVT